MKSCYNCSNSKKTRILEDRYCALKNTIINDIDCQDGCYLWERKLQRQHGLKNIKELMELNKELKKEDLI